MRSSGRVVPPLAARRSPTDESLSCLLTKRCVSIWILHIPIESIAKMMGHSGIKTTQRYAEVTDKKISKDMDNLMAVRMMYGTGKWYKKQELSKETDIDNKQNGK